MKSTPTHNLDFSLQTLKRLLHVTVPREALYKTVHAALEDTLGAEVELLVGDERDGDVRCPMLWAISFPWERLTFSQ